jgi:MFS family permease
MLFSLVAGALADNYNRRSLMLTAQFFMLVVSITLTVFAFLGLLTPWLLLTFTFLIGCGVALNNPSWQASVGDMVPREILPAAVTLNSVGFNITRSIGPAIGGAIVAAAGAAAAFAVNAFSYCALIFALLRWKPQARDETLPRETLLRALSAGLGYVAMSPNILNVLFRSGLFGLAASAILALLPIWCMAGRSPMASCSAPSGLARSPAPWAIRGCARCFPAKPSFAWLSSALPPAPAL